MKILMLVLDDDDWETVQRELASRDENELPEGTSNDEGAKIAEAIRDLNEYRALWEAEHPDGEMFQAKKDTNQ